MDNEEETFALSASGFVAQWGVIAKRDAITGLRVIICYLIMILLLSLAEGFHAHFPIIAPIQETQQTNSGREPPVAVASDDRKRDWIEGFVPALPP